MPFKLAGKLSLNSESFKKGLDKSGQAVKKMGTRMSSTFSRIGRRAKVAAHKIKKGFAGAATKVKGAFAGVGGKIAAVAGTAAIMDQVKQTIDWGTKVRDLSNAWGISTDEVQKFQYAARQSGIEIEDVMDNMKDLSKSAAEATAGNEGKASMFKTLGIDVDQLRNKNPAEIFRLVAAAIGDMDDTVTPEALIAIEGLGGGAGIKTLNMMKGSFAELTAEAEKLGLIVEDGVIQKLGGAGDAMAEMSDRWRSGWANALGFIFDAWDHFSAMLQAGMDGIAERLIALSEGRLIDLAQMGTVTPQEVADRQKKIMDDKKRGRQEASEKKQARENLQKKLDAELKKATEPNEADKKAADAKAAKETELERRQSGWKGFGATSLEKIGGGLGMKTTQLNVAQEHLNLAKKSAERAAAVANNVQEINTNLKG